jgi:hypothetical protein
VLQIVTLRKYRSLLNVSNEENGTLSSYCNERSPADCKLVEPVVHRNENVNMIIEAQRKFTVNFKGFHALEMEKSDDCALLEFHPE